MPSSLAAKLQMSAVATALRVQDQKGARLPTSSKVAERGPPYLPSIMSWLTKQRPYAGTHTRRHNDAARCHYQCQWRILHIH